MAAAHACGLLHRDVKPANLWLEAPAGWIQTPAAARPPLGAVGRIKLLDFGLAQPTADGPEDDDHVMGTPAYMAPEQARGEPLDPRCDLFGLGCVLYQMCTGRHPFPIRHRGDPLGWPPHVPPKPVRDLNPSVPPRLAGLIERMVAEKPDDRPDSARQVAQELAALERGHADPARTRTPGLRLRVRTCRRRRRPGAGGPGPVLRHRRRPGGPVLAAFSRERTSGRGHDCHALRTRASTVANDASVRRSAHRSRTAGRRLAPPGPRLAADVAGAGGARQAQRT